MSYWVLSGLEYQKHIWMGRSRYNLLHPVDITLYTGYLCYGNLICSSISNFYIWCFFLFLVFLPTLSGASAIFHYYIYTCLFILTWCPDQVPTGALVKFICFSCDHLINSWYNLARFFRFTAGCTVHGFSWHDPRYINYIRQYNTMWVFEPIK